MNKNAHIMKNDLLEATVKDTGKKVQVYRHRDSGNYVDFKDCKTMYQEKELIIGKVIEPTIN